jgi:hypothetical protein
LERTWELPTFEATPNYPAISRRETIYLTQLQKGMAAIGALTSVKEEKKSVDFTKIQSGQSIKVRVKGYEDLAQYFNYGLFGKVKSFVPEKPSVRDDKGYVVSDYTPWDLAEKYYRDLQFKEIRAKNKEKADEFGEEARKYKGTEKYLMGFFDLTSGEDIVVDMTRKQALTVYQTILEYSETDDDGNIIPDGEHDFKSMAFKLSKSGASTSTTFTLNPIINLVKGLTDEERENFDASAEKPFNSEMFDGLLFEADEKTQVENLVAAGFDISLIGFSIGGVSADTEDIGEPTELGDEDLPF